MTLPTTGAMVRAAQDAYDVAASDMAVASRKWREKADQIDGLSTEADELWARYIVAQANAQYAWGVLVATVQDRRRSAA